MKITEEVKDRNQEITSKWPLPRLNIYPLTFVLTRMPCCNLKDQCQEAYFGDPEGPRPLEGSMRVDGAGDRTGARLA
jgi:hypothetical protein